MQLEQVDRKHKTPKNKWHIVAGGLDHKCYDNVAIGSSTGINLSTAANENTFIGYNAGQGVTTGDRNTAIGMNAMASTDYSSGGKTGSDNIAIGRNTMSRNTGSGSNNVFIGSGNIAYRCNSGDNNIGIGQYTYYYLTSGSNNIALGQQALDYCDTCLLYTSPSPRDS